MTTPAQPQQKQPPPAQPPPPAVPAVLVPPQVAAAMVLPLAGLLLTATSAAALVAALRARFQLSALFRLALFLVLSQLVMPNPPPRTGISGPASEATARVNHARRALYVLAAARRVTDAMLHARAHGQDVTAAGAAAVEHERRYLQQHLDAVRQRANAAATADIMALEFGPLLGWAAVMDARTSRECRWANGKNFYPARPPAIGLPGAVHAACRCKPVRAWPGGRLMTGGAGWARAA